jgi:hypothetical protein
VLPGGGADGGMTWWCRMCDERPSGSRPFDGVKTISLKIKSKSSPGGWVWPMVQPPATAAACCRSLHACGVSYLM